MSVSHEYMKMEAYMSAVIINGNEIREGILADLREEVAVLKAKHGVVPGLVTIMLGEHPASVSYVSLKIKTAKGLGFNEIQVSLPENISETDLLDTIEKYNRDDRVHGILVQLPLPKHISEQKVINAIRPEKDVDGFHPVNVGKTLIGDTTGFRPCTPAGILEMIIRSGINTSGAEVVVVGRSNIVGKPIAAMMMQKGPGGDATVTVVHTRTKDLSYHCRRADILIVAAGVPGLVKSSWIKPGACVIDVGVNRVGEKKDDKTGRIIPLLRGDVDFEEAREIAGWITPVPGGVGPMTIAMLMSNTVRSLKRSLLLI